MMLSAAFTIACKDLRLRMRDRSVWIFALVVPVALSVVFGQLFAGNADDGPIRLGVLDEDGGEIANAFVHDMLPGLEAQGFVDIEEFATAGDVRGAIDSGVISAAWILPRGLSRFVTGGSSGTVRVVANPDHGIARLVAVRVAEGFATEADTVGVAVATMAALTDTGVTPSSLEAVRSAAMAQPATANVVDLVAPERQLSPTSYLAAGMAVFFLFFTVMFGVTGLLEERQLGTLARLRAAPISEGALHLGKAAGSLMLGLVSMAVLGAMSARLLDASWGPAGGVIVLIISACLAAVGVMTLVGSFARTAEQASNLLSMAALVLGLAGGVFFPVSTGALATLTVISPHGWFLRGLGDLAADPTWTAALPAAGALVAFGAVAGALAAARIRHQVRE
ncbi:MAG: ABC transporter permease [Nitriliruptoraceae bacterium]